MLEKETMDQKRRKLRRLLIKRDINEAFELGIKVRFQWINEIKAPIFIEGYAIACLFGPRGGRYVAIRTIGALFIVQWSKVKEMK